MTTKKRLSVSDASQKRDACSLSPQIWRRGEPNLGKPGPQTGIHHVHQPGIFQFTLCFDLNVGLIRRLAAERPESRPERLDVLDWVRRHFVFNQQLADVATVSG